MKQKSSNKNTQKSIYKLIGFLINYRFYINFFIFFYLFWLYFILSFLIFLSFLFCRLLLFSGTRELEFFMAHHFIMCSLCSCLFGSSCFCSNSCSFFYSVTAVIFEFFRYSQVIYPDKMLILLNKKLSKSINDLLSFIGLIILDHLHYHRRTHHLVCLRVIS